MVVSATCTRFSELATSWTGMLLPWSGTAAGTTNQAGRGFMLFLRGVS